MDGSRASDVTVFVRVTENGEEFIKQLATSDRNGLAHFTVPALQGDSVEVKLEVKTK